MDFLKSLAIAASGMRAQAGRMRVISENIANVDSTAQKPDSDPFRRRIATFSSEVDRALDARVVTLGKIRTDPTDFRLKVAQNLLQRLWLETRSQQPLPLQATSVWSVMPHAVHQGA